MDSLRVVLAATFVVIYGWFRALRRAYQPDLMSGRMIFIGRQPVQLPVARILNLIVFTISFAIAAITGASMMADWQTLARYWYAPSERRPCRSNFGKPLNFYLFSLPAWQTITGWLLMLAVPLTSLQLFSFNHRQHPNFCQPKRQINPAAVAWVLSCIRVLTAGRRGAGVFEPVPDIDR